MQSTQEQPSAFSSVAFPTTVRAAGLIWFIVGAGILSNAMLAQSAEVAIVSALIGGFFLYEGIATMRGALPTTAGIATGSILFAAIFIVMDRFMLERREVWESVLTFLTAACCVAAGILALRGAGQYETWWNAKKKHRNYEA